MESYTLVTPTVNLASVKEKFLSYPSVVCCYSDVSVASYIQYLLLTAI